MSCKLDLDSDDEEVSLTINKNYASRYENWRRKEELQKLKDKYGNDAELPEEGSSSSESDVPEWTTGDEKTFFKSLTALKTRDPSIYDKNCAFQSDSDSNEAEPSTQKSKKKKEKTFSLKDYERNLIVERQGIVDSDDEISAKKDPSYLEKLKKTKDEIKAALAEMSDDDESDGLLKKRVKTEEEKKKEKDDIVDWLKHEKPAKGKQAAIVGKLKQVWMRNDLSESDKFLRDYILEKKYDVSSDEEAIPTYEEIVNLDKEIEEEEKMDQFEQKFNYRFEDPDQEFIKQYPRTVSDTVRKTNEKRKEQREKYKERKEAEKNQRKEEIMRLRAMKKKEIEEKLEKLKKIAGKDEINFSIEDLEKDFDPVEYDQKMAKLFENDRVSENEDLEKPVFSDLSSDEDSDYDNIDVTKIKKTQKVDEESDDEEKEDEVEEKKVRGRPEELKASRRKRKRNTKLMEAVSKEKPLFNPKEKTFEEYFNEYYALNYEDIAKDGTIHRFHYRTVPPNDFGLTVDEILNADDRALNSWVSIKKVSAYRSEREEKSDLFAYKHKSKNINKKKQILSTDFGGKKSKKLKEQEDRIKKEVKELVDETNLPSCEVNVEETEDQQNIIESELTKKKNRRKKKSKNNTKPNEEENNIEEPPAKIQKTDDKIEGESEHKKSVRKKHKTQDKKQAPRDNTLDINDDRLRAYGINPTKYHRSRIYGKKKHQDKN
ncbi:Protein KRI1 homolog [Strongyloides ratti]|uniref:Protein KRI1 homolog n=1 Tax=Strongyloides ratti TaxID=34506 RepID=A0A090LMJ1_STRRB|nr:Protein KRI1 homolog [Strongyloides ratti]CEF68745.1 Protein KRI1 homolog [Strongyloides ratti]